MPCKIVVINPNVAIAIQLESCAKIGKISYFFNSPYNKSTVIFYTLYACTVYPAMIHLSIENIGCYTIMRINLFERKLIMVKQIFQNMKQCNSRQHISISEARIGQTSRPSINRYFGIGLNIRTLPKILAIFGSGHFSLLEKPR